MDSPKMKVKQIYTYPIKSIRGISLPSFPASYSGFPHDRRFMLFHVEKQKNMHVSGFPEMCLFHTSFADADPMNPRELVVTYSKDHVFDHPEQKVPNEPLKIDLQPDVTELKEVQVTMHGSSCGGHDMGDQFNGWFSHRFGYEVQLFYVGDNKRAVLGNMPPSVAVKQRAGLGSDNGSNASATYQLWSTISSTASAVIGAVVGGDASIEGEDAGIGFADVAPYLVVTTKSCENVSRRLPEGEEMDISKFRPNVIVEGAEEDFEEDFWADLKIGNQGVKIVLTQNCNRCNSLNVDYDTGKVGRGESGKVLKKLQSDRRVDKGVKYSPVFGRYGFLARLPRGQQTAQIHVGDEVTVLKRNAGRTSIEWPGISSG